jgi:hypothetical protein
MKTSRTSLGLLAGSVIVAMLLSAASVTYAQTVTYNIDPHQGRIVVSSCDSGFYGWGVFPQTAQVPGALVDSLEGTIVAASSGGTLTFGSGSSIRFRLNANSSSTDTNSPSFHPYNRPTEVPKPASFIRDTFDFYYAIVKPSAASRAP